MKARYWVAQSGDRRVLARVTDAEIAAVRAPLRRIGWTIAPASPLDVATVRAADLVDRAGRALAPRFELVAP